MKTGQQISSRLRIWISIFGQAIFLFLSSGMNVSGQSITVNSVTPSTLCSGGHVTVNFSWTGLSNANQNKVFVAQYENPTNTWNNIASITVSGSGKSSGTRNISGSGPIASGIFPVRVRYLSPDIPFNSTNMINISSNTLPQGSLSGNTICQGNTGQLTWTATAGEEPFTVIYFDGISNHTVSNIISGQPFNVFTNPNSTTTYTLVNVSDVNCNRIMGFTGGSANITVNPNENYSTNSEICEGDSYQWMGNNYSSAGTYFEYDQTQYGCQITYELNLTVHPTEYYLTEAEICEGDIYSWMGNDYTIGGTYYTSEQTQYYCDITYELNLIVHPTENYITDAEICEGEVYNWMGNDYTLSGTYYTYGQTQYGCEISYELNLTVHPAEHYITHAEICEEDTFSWRGNDYSIAGTYFEYGQSQNGCLITYELQLIVHPSEYDLTEAEICEGEVYIWMGNEYTAAGTYFEYGQTQYGCVITYELNLTVHPTEFSVSDAEICEGDTFSWMGNDYSVAGTYFEYDQTQYGCQITYELNLTVHPTEFYTEIDTVYEIHLPYLWMGNTYLASGTYYVYDQTQYGCLITYELNLTVKPGGPFRISKNIGTAIFADWDPIQGATMYQLRYRTLPAGGWTYANQSTQVFRKVIPLLPGTEYEIELRHSIGTVWQPWGEVYAPLIFTTKVITFVSTYDVGTKFIIGWTALEDVSSYVLQYRKVPSTIWTTKGYYTSNSAVMGSMEEGTDYEYRVCPRYSEVSFDWSQVGEVTSNYIVITVRNYDGTQADFSWDPVLNPAASDYYLQVREVGTTYILSSNYTNTTMRKVTGLITGKFYEYRLTVRYESLAWAPTSWRPLTGNKEEETAVIPNNMLKVYPNPVSDVLTVEINPTDDATNVWNLYDVNSMLVMSGNENLTKGMNYIQIDASLLPKGLYFLQSTFNGMIETSRILKQ